MSQKKTNNPFEKILNEFMASDHSYTSDRNASSWESNMIRWPHGATTNSGTHEKNFLNRAKDDEEKAVAPTIKPYPLDFINDSISNLYEEMIRLKATMKESLKYPDLGREDIKILQKEMKNIQTMIDNLQDMFYNIDKISL